MKKPFKAKAKMVIEFEFTTDADGVGDAEFDACRFLENHIMDDEGDNPINIKIFEIESVK